MDKEAFSRDSPSKSSNLGEKLNTEGKAKKAAGAKLRSEAAAQKAAAEKMRFEKAVFADEEPLSAKAKRVKQQKRYARKKPATSRAARMAEGKVRSEVDQNSDDNVGVEAANAGTQAAETAADTAGAAAGAGKAAGGASARGAGKAARETKNVMEKMAEFVSSHGHMILMLGGLLLTIMVVACAMGSCSAFFQSSTNLVVGTSYTADDADIIGAEEDYKELEAELQAKIDNIEDEYDGYDEYRIHSDQIGHDPYELASYLTIVFQSYKRNQVQDTLQELFDSQYELIIEEIVEIRTREVEHSSTDPETGEEDTWTETEEYEYYILDVTLRNNGLGKVITEAGLTEDEMSRYAVLMQTYGNRKEVFGDNPYAVAVEDVLHYDIPGEALTDEKFRRMIAEGEKYLGYPYVWGGSSPSTSFDCSGFVSWVVNHSGNGWSVGRQTAEGLRQSCSIIPRSEAKPGDLIFFKGTYNTSGASHVGIYVGDGMMLHCGKPIQYASCETSYWQSHFYCFGRLP